MHFTQEDYKKIESWLLRNSVKDTEFQEALPLTGDESVVITQDNHNRNLKIKDFVDEIIKVGIADFLNVTERYKSPNITLKEAIALVPDLLRNKGQVITFSNPDGNWEIYQFTGALNQWNNVTLWEDVFDIDKYIINSILPDEEDLTKSEPDENGNSYLSLKDKEYNPTEFSGLGRVILRKNLVEFEDGKDGKVTKNYLTQEDFSKENTIYEIRYDFDLNNQTIYIPSGCILKFVGGSIKNGILHGQDTEVDAPQVTIFRDIVLKGSFSADKAFSQWFGCISDLVLDENDIYVSGTNNLHQFNNLFLFRNVEIEKGNYYVEFTKEIKRFKIVQSHVRIDGGGSCIKYKYSDLYSSCLEINPYGTKYINDVHVKNLTIIGWRQEGEDETEHTAGISLGACSNVVVSNIISKHNMGDGFIIVGNSNFSQGIDLPAKSISIDCCKAMYNHRQGLSIGHCDGVLINNCDFSFTKGTAPENGIDIEPNYMLGDSMEYQYSKNIIIRNCRFEANNSDAIATFYGLNSSDYISNIIIEDCSIKGKGISLACCKNVYIKNCELADIIEVGIDLTGYTYQDIRIDNSRILCDASAYISNDSFGIYCRRGSACKNVSIDNCEVVGFKNGVYFDSAADSQDKLIGLSISNLILDSCQYSLWIDDKVDYSSYANITILNHGKFPDGSNRNAFGWERRIVDNLNHRKDYDAIRLSLLSSVDNSKGASGAVALKADGSLLKAGKSAGWVKGAEWYELGMLHKGLIGDSNNRPSYTTDEVVPYFDTDLEKTIYCQNGKWRGVNRGMASNTKIIYYQGGKLQLCYPFVWKIIQNATPIGILIRSAEGDVVLGLDVFSSVWSADTSVQDATTNSTNMLNMLNVTTGEEATKNLASAFGNADNAFSKALLYKKTDNNGNGIKEGNWWIPSGRECEVISENILGVNYCLKVLDYGSANIILTCHQYYSMAVSYNLMNGSLSIEAGKNVAQSIMYVSTLEKISKKNIFD